MPSTSTKVGHGLAKALGIKLNQEKNQDVVTRGESVFSVSTADTYVEEEPTAAEWVAEITPTGAQILHYVKSLFPFVHWMTRYNLQWLIGDLVAGITVGAVVVPQSMAYAKLAELPAEFGLYSSFMGVLIYWFFATSKDITIGPVAVMSTVTGNIVTALSTSVPQYEGHVVASALAVVAGGIVCGLGLLRLGWLVEFISLTAICAFMTGSAITIAVGQTPGMMGISSELFDTRAEPYRVFINTLKHLPDTHIDAAMGLSALTMLYLIRITCTTLANKYPNKRKLYFFLSTLRTAFVILLYTMISWLVNMHRRDDTLFKTLGDVPRGFQDAAVPTINSEIVNAFASYLPVTVIVLLIEHISISKSFGRINNYTIDPSQELVAIGVTNLLGPFLGAYPATGSFSRTAIKSKAGVRTPFAGVVTAIVVLLAIYALPAVFFYIPSASLSAVIIHAVGDLITPPNTVYQFWRISPLEVPIFFAGVLVTVFSTIENGIYTTISTSAALLLFRIFKARGRFLGRVKIHSVVGDHLLGDDEPKSGAVSAKPQKPVDAENAVRNIFLPLDHHDGTNPSISVESPYPGVYMFRFSEGYNYPNANHYLDYMVNHIFKTTRRTDLESYGKLGDRPWNDPGPRRGKTEASKDHLPTLKAIILDFSSVNNVDVTSVQHLIDVRNQLDRYVTPDTVEWHFAHIQNRWTKRALAAAGFGLPAIDGDIENQPWRPIYSVAEVGGDDSAAHKAGMDAIAAKRKRSAAEDLEGGKAQQASNGDAIEVDGSSSSEEGYTLDQKLSQTKYGTVISRPLAVVHGLNRPLFHVDLTSALQAAIHNIEHRPRK